MRGLGRLGDYTATLPFKTSSAESKVLGPLQTPIKVPAADDRLDRLIEEIRKLPVSIVHQFRESYLKGGRDQQGFVFTGVGTAIAAAATSTIISFSVQQDFEGALQKIGINVVTPPPTNAAWSIRINGRILHPGFTNIAFSAGSLSEPLEFELELLQGRLYELIVTNNGGAAINVEAIILGYTSYMAEWKKWGNNPKSGIG